MASSSQAREASLWFDWKGKRSFPVSKGRFLESKELKRLIRDRIAPENQLGHSNSMEKVK